MQLGSPVPEFLALRPGDQADVWLLEVTKDVAGATGTLHGGCALAAAAVVLETATQRPVSSVSYTHLTLPTILLV